MGEVQQASDRQMVEVLRHTKLGEIVSKLTMKFNKPKLNQVHTPHMLQALIKFVNLCLRTNSNLNMVLSKQFVCYILYMHVCCAGVCFYHYTIYC